jgi:hypothetical protein
MSKSNAGRIGVWGASGSGKSSYAKRRIKGIKRLVVFDPLAEYGPLCKITVSSVDQVRQAMRADWKGFRIAYKPTPGQEVRCLSSLCRLLMAAQGPYQETGRGSGLTLVVEEMNLSFPVAGGDQKNPGFAEICSRGRHFGIEVIGLSQRIAEVATRFRGNCTETVVLRQKGPRDLKAASEELGVGVTEVSKLENLQYLHEQGGKITPGKISFK